jgi:hypothetical protein
MQCRIRIHATAAAVFAGATLVAASPQSGIDLPPGYRVELIASGLSGPEGLEVVGAGQVAVVESVDVPPAVPSSTRLTMVARGGHMRPLASHESADIWVDVVGHPGGGFYVASLGLGGPDQPGIYHVDPNGEVTNLGAPPAHYVSIVRDDQTGDLYTARVPFSGAPSIARISPEGFATTIQPQTRAQGLLVTPDRVLIASVQFRNAGGQPFRNQVIAWDLASGAEAVLASNVGTLAGCLAMGRSGDLYLSDFKDGSIRRIAHDGTGGYTVSAFASGFSSSSARYPPGPTQLSFNYLAFDQAGGLYVTDYGSGTLYRITGSF